MTDLQNYYTGQIAFTQSRIIGLRNEIAKQATSSTAVIMASDLKIWADEMANLQKGLAYLREKLEAQNLKDGAHE